MQRRIPEVEREWCEYAIWFEGCKQPKDNGMPERSWGCYLPGDEPGWECRFTGENCTPDWNECPRISQPMIFCPNCQLENGDPVRIWCDLYHSDRPCWCPECGEFWADVEELEENIKEIK